VLKSIHSKEYKLLLSLIVAARKRAQISQFAVAKSLGKPQSFMAKVENGERRLDVVEFLRLCRLLRADPYAMLRDVEMSLTDS
jgi:transcriptional regulator with XRE-family HTH domain